MKPAIAAQRTHGFTLVEMLVAMTASLILFATVVTVLQILGDAVSRSRRAGRLDSDMCSIRTRLQLDLAGVTANRDANGLLVEVDSGSVSGYFEAIEGPNSDLLDFSQVSAVNQIPDAVYDRSANAAGPTTKSNDRIVGDTDDLLLFTTRSVATDPFVGQFLNEKKVLETISSEQAEVAYFCSPTPGTSSPTLYTLYRRQLLVIGGFPRLPFASDGSMEVTSAATVLQAWRDFYASYDLSARRELRPEGTFLVLNTVNDLQRRRNRFAHDPVCSGSTRDLHPLDPNHPNNVLAFAGQRKDEDALATNVLSFDIRVLDPQAVERQAPFTVRMQPADETYWTPNSAAVATTAPVYVDIGFNAFALFHQVAKAPGAFGGYGRTGHCLEAQAFSNRTFDTWTSFYDANNQDDDRNGQVDDDAEQPPYSEPLGGVQVVVRLYDTETRTVKQATITQSFKP